MRQKGNLLLQGSVAIGAQWQDAAAPGPYVLEGVELATALVYGEDKALPPLRLEGPLPSPRAVLEAILLEGLRRSPCLVGFSGGRDSSGLLALVAHVARKEGLSPPVAVTNIFPGDTNATESEWQEQVIRHAGITEWERIHLTHEMDVVGPLATPLLQRYGPTFPFNGHSLMPGLGYAKGGTYVTGIGGDELFAPNDRTRLALVLTGGLRPRLGDLAGLLRRLGPERLAVRHWRRAITPEPWLRPGVSRLFLADLAKAVARQHLWFVDQVLDDVWRDRSRAAGARTLCTFGSSQSVDVQRPFQDPRLLRSVAAHMGRTGWHSRSAAMDQLFGDVLPVEVVRRQTKATFDSVFFNEHSRAFAQEWDGQGVDPTLVDPDRLLVAWQQPSVDPRSLSLLQGAWYSRERRLRSTM